MTTFTGIPALAGILAVTSIHTAACIHASQVFPAIAVLPLLSVVDTDPVGSKTVGDPELNPEKIICDPDPGSSRSEKEGQAVKIHHFSTK
jgi:hypothetical protein